MATVPRESTSHLAPTAGAIQRSRARMEMHSPSANEFLGATFPEHFFSPAGAARSAYEGACRRGYAAMAGKRVVVTGLARNLGSILPTTIRRLQSLCRLFADHRVVIYENDSVDNTKLLLRQWSLSDRRVTVGSENLHDPVNPTSRCLKRVGRMAAYRRRCQEMILADHGRFDAVIVVDLDILGGWSEDGIANSFGHREWDFIGSNGLIYRRDGRHVNTLRQYDTWALRVDDELSPIPTRVAGSFVFRCGEPLVPVTSCFGGLGIYRMAAYAAGEYAGGELEHANFHRSLIGQGFTGLFLNPSQIVMYGRRHRSGDAAVRSVLTAWSRVTGRPTEPWMFRKGEHPEAVDPLGTVARSPTRASA